MANVNIRIELIGLALCFLKAPRGEMEKVWNVAFLCDAQHRLELSVNGSAFQGWSTPNEDIVFKVDHSDLSACDRGNFEDLLNISNRIYGHGRIDEETSKLQIERRKTRTVLAWMQVPHSAMNVDDTEDAKIMRTDPDHGVPKRVPDCGKEVRLTFKTTRNLILNRRRFGTAENLTPITIPLSSAENNRITLRFNNACYGNGCIRNDFVDLYEFVKHEENNQEVRYISWAEDAEREVAVSGVQPKNKDKRVAQRTAVGWIESDTQDGDVELVRKRFLDRYPFGMRSVYGNCDPVASDPPPGGNEP